MATPKILGIETEFGVAQVGSFGDPIVQSSLLVNAYAHASAGRIRWDFFDETPQRDARGATPLDAMPPMVESNLANTVLTNGARFYVDHAHPEYSSPECSSALEAVRYDVAGEWVLRRAMEAVRSYAPQAPELVVYKNNSDGKGNSYGCHENYLIARDLPFSDVVAACVPHFISRIIFCGAGKVGADFPDRHGQIPAFQLSQRAEFFEEIIGLETTVKRPIVNTRDEPHADPSKYRRLHVIAGDANLAEVATFLKLGTTALILAMVEDGHLDPTPLWPADPVHAFRAFSADPSLSAAVDLDRGGSMTALEMQWVLYEAAVAYADRFGLAVLGADGSGALTLERWGRALHALEVDPATLAREVDWVAKRRLVEGLRDRHGLAAQDPRLEAVDLQYHDLRLEKSLAARCSLERLTLDADVRSAETAPPRTTRAYFRGMALTKFRDAVDSANWDSVVFDVGEEPLRRVPMMDPTKGTAAQTEALFDRCSSARELVAELEGEEHHGRA